MPGGDSPVWHVEYRGMNPDDVKPKTDATFTPPSDPSDYIRTYAKDVAMLTNSPAPKVAAAPAKPADPEDGVALPEYDTSPVNHSDNPSSPKEFKAEVVELLKDDSDGIFNSFKPAVAPTPAPMSMMPQASIGVTPNIAPTKTTAPTGVAPEETKQEREAILTRLRAKLASHESPVPPAEPSAPLTEPVTPIVPATPPPSPPQFVRPIEAPVQPLPVREQEPEVAPPIIIEPAPRAVPQPAAAVDPNPSPLHTFSSDFSDRIDSQRASTFSVLAAQNDAGPAKPAPKTRSRLLPIIAGVVLLIGGIAAVTTAYIFSSNKNATPVVAGVPSLLTFDESVEVKGSGPALMQAIADVAGQASVTGNVIVTYVTAPTATGGSAPQPGGALITALSLGAPDILMRNIDNSSTVGTVHAGSESRPFLVLRVNSYERTFAGMLAWEPDMASSLATFYPAYVDVAVPVVASSSTANTTTPQSIGLSSPYFTDAVVANHDVRILKDSKGRSLLLYGYQGKDTLIIARDEEAFTALIARLTATPAQ